MDIEEDSSRQTESRQYKRLQKSSTVSKDKEKIYVLDVVGEKLLGIQLIHWQNSSFHEEKSTPDTKLDSSTSDQMMDSYLQNFSFKKDLSKNRMKVEYTPMTKKSQPKEITANESKPETALMTPQKSQSLADTDKKEATEVLMW